MTRGSAQVECHSLGGCGVEAGVPSCSSIKVENLRNKGIKKYFKAFLKFDLIR